jgi:hypothetical protein
MKRAGVVSDDLPSQYVNNLYRGVKRFASEDFEFILFTNQSMKVDEGITVKQFPLISQYGVLPRLWMFSKEAGLAGHQVLCLDLDVVIVGSLKPLLDYTGVFAGRGRFKPGFESELDGDIMSFKAGAAADKLFWQPFVKDIPAAEKFTGGRERYWIRHIANDFAEYWNDICPGAVVSYKWHVRRQKKLPQGASIVSCHGVPRPHQIQDKWIKEYWK